MNNKTCHRFSSTQFLVDKKTWNETKTIDFSRWIKLSVRFYLIKNSFTNRKMSSFTEEKLDSLSDWLELLNNIPKASDCRWQMYTKGFPCLMHKAMKKKGHRVKLRRSNNIECLWVESKVHPTVKNVKEAHRFFTSLSKLTTFLHAKYFQEYLAINNMD